MRFHVGSLRETKKQLPPRRDRSVAEECAHCVTEARPVSLVKLVPPDRRHLLPGLWEHLAWYTTQKAKILIIRLISLPGLKYMCVFTFILELHSPSAMFVS